MTGFFFLPLSNLVNAPGVCNHIDGNVLDWFVSIFMVPGILVQINLWINSDKSFDYGFMGNLLYSVSFIVILAGVVG